MCPSASGSGRRPGHWNGCFAMRPSLGVLPVEGYVPSFRSVTISSLSCALSYSYDVNRRFDTPTFFGRDIVMCESFAYDWYGKKLRVSAEVRKELLEIFHFS